MAFTYKFLAGGKAVVDVDHAWTEKLEALDKNEAANELYHTRSRKRAYLDLTHTMDSFEGREPNPIDVVCSMESCLALFARISTLTPRQLEVLKMKREGMSGREIARHEGKNERAIRKVLIQIQKKFPEGGTQTP